jgi:hypothetical protein
MSNAAIHERASRAVADGPLREILREISVPLGVLAEARRRRDLVLDIAMEHPAARAMWRSGSTAHGTHNRPLEDADGGNKINRRHPEFRLFGPDAGDGGRGPEEFIEMFVPFIEPRLRATGYPNATANLDGNRAIKWEFNSPIAFDDWGVVDPYVDQILGLTRAEGSGLWIPNRRRNGWDPGDPEYHTWLMTERDPLRLRVRRAHVIRLVKRAVKRDEVIEGRVQVMCSWNISALALELVGDAEDSLGDALATFLWSASDSIAAGLTEDPSPAISDPIKLPDGVTRDVAAARLAEMASVVTAAVDAYSPQAARAYLEELFGPEVEAVRERERRDINRALRDRDSAPLAAAVGLPTTKPTRSDGD